MPLSSTLFRISLAALALSRGKWSVPRSSMAPYPSLVTSRPVRPRIDFGRVFIVGYSLFFANEKRLRRWRRLAEDHIRRLLRHHHHCGVGIAADDHREDGGVGHPQALDASDLEFVVHHGRGVAAHPARADLVVDVIRDPADIFDEFVVALQGGAGAGLHGVVSAEGRGGEDLAGDT